MRQRGEVIDRGSHESSAVGVDHSDEVADTHTPGITIHETDKAADEVPVRYKSGLSSAFEAA